MAPSPLRSETALPMALFEPQFSRDGRRIAGESPDQTVTICEIAGACRAITPKIDRGLTSLGWSADGARIFYLQRTDRPGWGELKSIGVDGSTLRSHGIVGPLRPYEMLIGVSPLDEVAFAPYREGPHELWTAQLR